MIVKNKSFSRAALVSSLSLTALAVAFSLPAHAVTLFTGPYDVSNWDTFDDDGGSVDTSGAPNSISLTSPDEGFGGAVEFFILAPSNDVISFSWSYLTNDQSPEWDPFGYSLGGIFTQLTDNNGLVSQSGTTSFVVNENQEFGFYAQSTDGVSGAATTTITNFSATAVPLETDALPVVGSALFIVGGLWWKRRRNQVKVSDLIANSVTTKI